MCKTHTGINALDMAVEDAEGIARLLRPLTHKQQCMALRRLDKVRPDLFGGDGRRIGPWWWGLRDKARGGVVWP